VSLFLLSALVAGAIFFALLMRPAVVLPKGGLAFLATLTSLVLLILMEISYFFVIDIRRVNSTQSIIPNNFVVFFMGYDFRQMIFGVVFGLLFSYWLSSILNRDPKGTDKATYFREGVIGGLLLIFLLLGIGGQDAIVNLISRVTNVKVGSAELTLAAASDRDRGSQTALAAVYPPSAAILPYTSPDTSSGLGLILKLGDFVKRDALYSVLRSQRLSGQSGRPKDVSQFVEAFEFVDKYIQPLAGCLSDYVASTSDVEQVGKWIAAPARSIRSLLMLHQQGELINQKFSNWNISSRTPPVPEQDPSLPNRIIADIISVGDNVFANSLKGHANCDEAAGIQKEILENKESRDSFILYIDGSARSRPYIRLLAADALAFHHEYTAAILLLDEWTRAREFFSIAEEQRKTEYNDENKRIRSIFPGFEKCKNSSDILSDVLDACKIRDTLDVYEIRVRTQIATLIEEWLSFQPFAKTQAVMNYHRANIDAEIKLIERYLSVDLSIMTLPERVMEFTEEIDDFSTPCGVTEGRSWKENGLSSNDKDRLKIDPKYTDKNMRKGLVYSLFTLKNTWINLALDSDVYYSELAPIAARYAEEMVRTNLACLNSIAGEGKERDKFISTLRAQSFQAFAQVELNNLAMLQDISLMKDDKQRRLRSALRAADLGLKAIHRFQEENRQRSLGQAAGKTFLERISPSEAVEIYDKLLNMSRTLQARLNRF
jgi:hypothetical protein